MLRVSDDARRYRVCEALKDFGRRVQYSVFECDLDQARADVMINRLLELTEPEDQLRVAAVFGEINTQGAKGVSNLHYISNARPDGRLGDSEILLHADQCFCARPQRVLMLHGVEVPSKGGETLFSNAIRAHAELPDRLKKRVALLHALHAFHYSEKRRRDRRTHAGDILTADPTDTATATHPVALRHPRPILDQNTSV